MFPDFTVYNLSIFQDYVFHLEVRLLYEMLKIHIYSVFSINKELGIIQSASSLLIFKNSSFLASPIIFSLQPQYFHFRNLNHHQMIYQILNQITQVKWTGKFPRWFPKKVHFFLLDLLFPSYTTTRYINWSTRLHSYSFFCNLCYFLNFVDY